MLLLLSPWIAAVQAVSLCFCLLYVVGAVRGDLSVDEQQQQQQQQQHDRICQLVLDLSVSSKRELALLELSKRREAFADIAPLLWHSFGTMAAILQEIISA